MVKGRNNHVFNYFVIKSCLVFIPAGFQSLQWKKLLLQWISCVLSGFSVVFFSPQFLCACVIITFLPRFGHFPHVGVTALLPDILNVIALSRENLWFRFTLSTAFRFHCLLWSRMCLRSSKINFSRWFCEDFLQQCAACFLPELCTWVFND